MRRAAWALVAGCSMVAGLGAVACSGGAGEVAPVSLEPIATTLPAAATTPPATGAPTTAVATPDTTQPDTTQPDTTVAELTGPVFSDALGVKVASAPGVNTPGDTRQLLPEGLYVHIAWTADPADPSVFTVQPDDIPILEAYANAVTTYYRAAMTTMTTDDPGFAEYFVDRSSPFEKSFDLRRQSGQRMLLGGGVVLRPYLLSDKITASTAVVLDCYLTDEVYLVEGDLPRASGSPVPVGQVVTMARVNGRWLVDKAGPEPQACV
jgi:hypothetical protein